jgi:hypothetical protein
MCGSSRFSRKAAWFKFHKRSKARSMCSHPRDPTQQEKVANRINDVLQEASCPEAFWEAYRVASYQAASFREEAFQGSRVGAFQGSQVAYQEAYPSLVAFLEASSYLEEAFLGASLVGSQVASYQEEDHHMVHQVAYPLGVLVVASSQHWVRQGPWAHQRDQEASYHCIMMCGE